VIGNKTKYDIDAVAEPALDFVRERGGAIGLDSSGRFSSMYMYIAALFATASRTPMLKAVARRSVPDTS
jgi:hypothetical protein